MTLTYLTADSIVSARTDAAPAHHGSDRKVPTAYRLTLTDGRERRVYAALLGNSASLYVVRGGQNHYLSTVVESALEGVRDGATWPDALAAIVALLGNAGLADVELVKAYGRTLALHGFEVTFHTSGRIGFLTYRDPETGYRGTFERSEFEGWDHHMPLVPTVTYGSSMWHLADDAPRWTVDAARLTARELNWNPIVGSQFNAGDAYRPLSGGESL